MLHLKTVFDKVAIFTLLFILVHDHGSSFHLLVFFFNYFFFKFHIKSLALPCLDLFHVACAMFCLLALGLL